MPLFFESDIYIKDNVRTPRKILMTFLAENEATRRPIFSVEGPVEDKTVQQEDTRRELERLRLALEATTDGVWDWDIQTGSLLRRVVLDVTHKTSPTQATNSSAR